MVIRDAQEADIAAIAGFFRAIVAAGETYAYPEDLDDRGVAELWIEAPPCRTVVAADEDGTVLGSASMGPNRPGRGAHIATASFMVDPEAQGRGIGRRSSMPGGGGWACTSCIGGCERCSGGGQEPLEVGDDLEPAGLGVLGHFFRVRHRRHARGLADGLAQVVMK